MAPLRLSAVTRTQGNNKALKDGRVVPSGFALEFEEVPVLVHAFRRMVRGLEFDVCEMAFTTYVCAKAHGVRFTALPIFLVRGFHHGAIHACVTAPRALEGRRVAVNRGYTVTTGVWARGILADEYDVDLDRVTWIPTGDEHVAAYRPPGNVEPLPTGADLEPLVRSGEIVASVGFDSPTAGLVPLIPDAREAGFAALAATGLYPINHLIVVRDDVLAAYPELPTALFTSFAAAKQMYVSRLRAGVVENATDEMYKRVMEITNNDPLPYGIEPNRPMIEKLLDHAARQRIITHRPAVEDLFAAGTHALTA